MLAVSDTCFLIDWFSYRKNWILTKIFKGIFVPEQVLDEVKREDTLVWLSDNMAKGNFVLFTPTNDVLSEARRIINIVASTPWARKIELPEALCLAAGRLFGYVVLTENRGALMIGSVLPEYATVKIYKSIDVLREAMMRGVISISKKEDVLKELSIFSKDTKHIFRKSDVEELIEAVLGDVSGGG